MTRREEYESKFISIDEALALIRDPCSAGVLC